MRYVSRSKIQIQLLAKDFFLSNLRYSGLAQPSCFEFAAVYECVLEDAFM